MSAVVCGIFVGGAARRMGGAPKGLLPGPSGEPLVATLLATVRALGLPAVLVGRAEAYAAFGVEALADDPPGIGPLGGLAALLARADDGQAVAIACDMPYVTRPLLARLVAHAPDATILAPRRGGVWEPLFARYDARAVRPIVARRIQLGERSLQGLLTEAAARALPMDEGEARALDDWDSPEDVTRGTEDA